MIGIVQILELETVLGAFLAGMILSTYFHYQKGLSEKLNDFGFGFFIPLFFIYVGSTLDLKLIIIINSTIKPSIKNLIMGPITGSELRKFHSIEATVTHKAYNGKGGLGGHLLFKRQTTK